MGKNLLNHESESIKFYAIAETKEFNPIFMDAEKNRKKDHVLDVIKFINKEDLDSLKKCDRTPPFLHYLIIYLN